MKSLDEFNGSLNSSRPFRHDRSYTRRFVLDCTCSLSRRGRTERYTREGKIGWSESDYYGSRSPVFVFSRRLCLRDGRVSGEGGGIFESFRSSLRVVVVDGPVRPVDEVVEEVTAVLGQAGEGGPFAGVVEPTVARNVFQVWRQESRRRVPLPSFQVVA